MRPIDRPSDVGSRASPWASLVVAVAVACHGGGSDTDPLVGDCANGALDGDETAIDCGGACGATCGLGEACGSGVDCLFGLCDDVCIAPTDGPAPTGEVTTTVPAEGGTLTVVTDEGVTVTLAIPAGALSEATAIRLTPLPVAREWARLEMEPAGLVFDAPVPVEVALPASVPDAADGMIGFAGPEERIVVATTSGATLTADLDYLGLPGFVAPPSTARSFPSPTDLLMAVPVNFATRVALADNLLTAYESTHRYRDALELNAIVARILSDGSHPQYEELATPFLERAWGVACSGLADARSNMVAHTNPGCVSDAKRFERPVLDWVALLMKLDGIAPSACEGFSDDVWLTQIEAHQLRIPVPTGWAWTAPGHPEALLKDILSCDCEFTPEEDWTLKQQIECPRLRDVPTVQGDWDLLIDGVERGNEQALLDRFVGLPADAGDGLVDPYTASVRAQVYDGCRRDASTLNPGKLLDVLAVPGAFRTDAHYCASTLAWEARDSSGDPQGSGAIGGGERPGQQQVAGTVAVSADGQLVLNGPIAALTCPDPVEVESEELVIEAVGSARGEVARLSPSAGLLLADGSNLTLGVATLFAAAGLDPDVDASVTLEVTRDGPGCDGLYGAAPNPLLTVDARLPGMKVRVDEAAPFTATPSLCSQLVDPYVQATFAPATLPTTCSAAGSTTTVSWDDASTVAVDATHTGFYSLTRLELEFTRPGTLTLEVFPWGAGFVRVAVNEYQVTQWASVYEHKGSNGSYQTAPAPCAAATVTVPIDQPGKLRWSLFVFTPEGSGDGRVLTLHFE